MSDGLRVVDAGTPAAPKGRAFYVPPAVADPTGNYATVPLVVDVEKLGSRFLIADISGGLYVLNVVLSKQQCMNGGFADFGFANQGTCVSLFEEATP